MDAQQYISLLEQQFTGRLDPAQWEQLNVWLEDPGNRERFIDIAASLMEEGGVSAAYNHEKWDPVLRNILNADTVPVVRRLPFIRTAWFKYAAAVIVILTGLAVYYMFSRGSQSETAVVQNVPAVVNDVAPGYNRAVLTLSNGQKVELDSAASETIKDGNLAIENVDGGLRYVGPSGRQARPLKVRSGEPVAYNTMSTPKGGQYKLTLADGTTVWLNAASSITYPTAFIGARREVTVTGEAYFKVSGNSKQPFIVKTPTENITVLGTEFNVNAYADEPSMKTSLLEGSVKVGEKILKPGQAFSNGKVVETNIAQDVAWKNGFFNFNEIDLKAMLRQISRWYDIDIEYAGNVPERKFGGRMRRDLKLSGVLSLLDNLGIKYQLNGKTLVI